jgi:hypothetical protein
VAVGIIRSRTKAMELFRAQCHVSVTVSGGGVPTLTERAVSCLQFLLVILRPQPCGTHDHISLFRGSSNLEGPVARIYIAPKEDGPIKHPATGLCSLRFLRLEAPNWLQIIYNTYMKIQLVPNRKDAMSPPTKISQLMLFRKIVTLPCENDSARIQSEGRMQSCT